MPAGAAPAEVHAAEAAEAAEAPARVVGVGGGCAEGVGHRGERAIGVVGGRRRGRHVVEQCVGWLKEFRRIGTRFEKLAVNFLAMIHLAMIKRYLKLLF